MHLTIEVETLRNVNIIKNNDMLLCAKKSIKINVDEL